MTITGVTCHVLHAPIEAKFYGARGEARLIDLGRGVTSKVVWRRVRRRNAHLIGVDGQREGPALLVPSV
jgi:hypothetical protein